MPYFDFKIAVISDCNVGKSHIINRYLGNEFEPLTKPDECEFKEKRVLSKYEVFRLKIFNSSGTSKDLNSPRINFNNIDGVIIVYDVTNRDSFDGIDAWLKVLPEQNTCEKQVPIVLVGNKIDLVRTVTEEEGQQLSQKLKIHYMETSAKTNEGVIESFTSLIKLIHEQKKTLMTDNAHKEEHQTTEDENRRCDCFNANNCCLMPLYYVCVCPAFLICICCIDCDGYLSYRTRCINWLCKCRPEGE